MRAAGPTLEQRVTTLEQRANHLRSDLDALTADTTAWFGVVKQTFTGIGHGPYGLGG